ncbi:hypothetical protein PanWU01x14_213220 [Parasponia andersonii]|uniref:Secreted protein n=1 Tax=Parasponia andersonii TaxID=3476 RepID=A0A2P5BSX8_PARAD|nr:hypothetical protein PanWU01x14_213220 [Parasponia andersonii]
MMIFIFSCFVWLLTKDLQTVAWANRQRCLRLWFGLGCDLFNPLKTQYLSHNITFQTHLFLFDGNLVKSVSFLAS